MADPTSKKLTPSDPVSRETLRQFDELDSARYELGAQLLNLEQEKVRVLSAAHQVETQRQRLFEKLLVERGLEPNTRIEIESKTGAIKLLDTAPKAAAE